MGVGSRAAMNWGSWRQGAENGGWALPGALTVKGGRESPAIRRKAGSDQGPF